MFKELLHPFKTEFELVRIGNGGDGGYVVPKAAVESSDHLMSFGVGDNISFEEDFHRMNGSARIDTYDFSVDGNPENSIDPGILEFHKLMVLAGTAEAGRTSLKTLVGESGGLSIFVKCDIEGGEFGLFEELSPEDFGRIACIVVEIHNWDGSFSEEERSIFECMDRNGFAVVHFHGNTNAQGFMDGGVEIPQVVEVTFLNRGRFPVSGERVSRRYPIEGLDDLSGYGHPPFVLDYSAE